MKTQVKIRSQTLYPIELRALNLLIKHRVVTTKEVVYDVGAHELLQHETVDS